MLLEIHPGFFVNAADIHHAVFDDEARFVATRDGKSREYPAETLDRLRRLTSSVLPAQPGSYAIFATRLPKGKTAITVTPLIGWRVMMDGPASPVTAISHPTRDYIIASPEGLLQDASGAVFSGIAAWVTSIATQPRAIGMTEGQ